MRTVVHLTSRFWTYRAGVSQSEMQKMKDCPPSPVSSPLGEDFCNYVFTRFEYQRGKSSRGLLQRRWNNCSLSLEERAGVRRVVKSKFEVPVSWNGVEQGQMRKSEFVVRPHLRPLPQERNDGYTRAVYSGANVVTPVADTQTTRRA